MLMQTEEDADQDIEGVKRRFGEQYAKTLAATQRLQGENSVLTRDMAKLRQQVDDLVRLSDRVPPPLDVRGVGRYIAQASHVIGDIPSLLRAW